MTAVVVPRMEVCDRPGGEGSGKGSGSKACHPVAIKSNRTIRIRPDVGVSKAQSSSGYVTEQGRVEQVQVEQSAGHADLDAAAVEAVGRWRFRPARRGRQTIAMWVSIPCGLC